MRNLFLVGIHMADTSKLDDIRSSIEYNTYAHAHAKGIMLTRNLVDILESHGLGRIKFKFTGFKLFDLDSLEFVDISLDEYLNSDIQINGLDLDKSGDLLINVSGNDRDSINKVVPLFICGELLDLDYKIGEGILFSNRKCCLEIGEDICYVGLTLDAEKEDFDVFYRYFCITSHNGLMYNKGYYRGVIHRGLYNYPINDLIKTIGVDVACGIWYYKDIAVISGRYSDYDTYIVRNNIRTVVIDVKHRVNIVLPKSVYEVVVKDCCNHGDELAVIYLSKDLNPSDLRSLVIETAKGFIYSHIEEIESLSTDAIIDKLRIDCVDIQYY